MDDYVAQIKGEDSGEDTWRRAEQRQREAERDAANRARQAKQPSKSWWDKLKDWANEDD
jgi:hypothetical protein